MAKKRILNSSDLFEGTASADPCVTQPTASRNGRNKLTAGPFLKWAGGKTQLLEELDQRFPKELKEGKVKHYYEPFIGGGAVFFYLREHYDIADALISDSNPELILVYTVVQKETESLIAQLHEHQKHYRGLSEEEQLKYYYRVREEYNEGRHTVNFKVFDKDSWVPRAAQMIFLNRTCFNGLFRLNATGGFNVPKGHYKNPTIANAETLRKAAKLLQGVRIEHMTFEELPPKVLEDSFVYFDPPYRPLSATSSFTAYSASSFNDESQKTLAQLYGYLARRDRVWLMLSNSDTEDGFFDELYKEFVISRVFASRNINSVASKRGKIKELVITNYEPNSTPAFGG